MFAKRFFYVCAGFLCLALAYHLGASSATAAKPGSITAIGVSPKSTSTQVTGASDRTIYCSTCSGSGGPEIVPFPVPGTAQIIGTGPGSNEFGGVTAVLANGDIYYAFKPAGAWTNWTLTGNLLATQ